MEVALHGTVPASVRTVRECAELRIARGEGHSRSGEYKGKRGQQNFFSGADQVQAPAATEPKGSTVRDKVD